MLMHNLETFFLNLQDVIALENSDYNGHTNFKQD